MKYKLITFVIFLLINVVIIVQCVGEQESRVVQKSTCSPGALVFCTPFVPFYSENEWSYSLGGDEILGLIVSTGDQIHFEGSGIKDGFVRGDVATKEYGAWRVVESEPGRVVFEATVRMYLEASGNGDRPEIGEFVLISLPGAIRGEIQYYTLGDWIGNRDFVWGPVIVK